MRKVQEYVLVACLGSATLSLMAKDANASDEVAATVDRCFLMLESCRSGEIADAFDRCASSRDLALERFLEFARHADYRISYQLYQSSQPPFDFLWPIRLSLQLLYCPELRDVHDGWRAKCAMVGTDGRKLLAATNRCYRDPARRRDSPFVGR